MNEHSIIAKVACKSMSTCEQAPLQLALIRNQVLLQVEHRPAEALVQGQTGDLSKPGKVRPGAARWLVSYASASSAHPSSAQLESAFTSSVPVPALLTRCLFSSSSSSSRRAGTHAAAVNSPHRVVRLPCRGIYSIATQPWRSWTRGAHAWLQPFDRRCPPEAADPLIALCCRP